MWLIFGRIWKKFSQIPGVSFLEESLEAFVFLLWKCSRIARLLCVFFLIHQIIFRTFCVLLLKEFSKTSKTLGVLSRITFFRIRKNLRTPICFILERISKFSGSHVLLLKEIEKISNPISALFICQKILGITCVLFLKHISFVFFRTLRLWCSKNSKEILWFLGAFFKNLEGNRCVIFGKIWKILADPCLIF